MLDNVNELHIVLVLLFVQVYPACLKAQDCVQDGDNEIVTCPRNCGSSAISGSWAPDGFIEQRTGDVLGSSIWTGPGNGPDTFTEDILFSVSDQNLSELVAGVRCERDEDMPWKCRLHIGTCRHFT